MKHELIVKKIVNATPITMQDGWYTCEVFVILSPPGLVISRNLIQSDDYDGAVKEANRRIAQLKSIYKSE